MEENKDITIKEEPTHTGGGNLVNIAVKEESAGLRGAESEVKRKLDEGEEEKKEAEEDITIKEEPIETKEEEEAKLTDRIRRTRAGDKRIFICHYCDKPFVKYSGIKKHIMSHTGEKPHECHVCHRCFTDPGNLKVHIRIHTGEKPYKCPYCEKSFSRKNKRTGHIRTHTGEKPYKCSYCHKCFALNDLLKRHILTHTGEKPYKCSYCGKCFATNGNLKRHIWTHTGGNGNRVNGITVAVVKGEPDWRQTVIITINEEERPIERESEKAEDITVNDEERPIEWENEECEAEKAKLTTTTTTVNGGIIQRCEKRFGCTHIRIHTGGKPYKCTRCGKCFSQLEGLTVHVRTHTGEKKLYKCSRCDRSFADIGVLMDHIRAHTGEENKKKLHVPHIAINDMAAP